MKSLVIYHSNFGNTKLLAEEIAKVFGKEALLKHASDLSDNDFKSIGLLVVGSPIIGWMPSEPVKDALSNLGDGMLKGVRAASFDTRMKVFFHGDATKKMSKKLEQAGAEIISKPEAFYVKGKEGPLFEGEIERAKEWAGMLKKKSS